MNRPLLSVVPLAFLASCVAIVEAPTPLPPPTPCDVDNYDACPEGFECGYFTTPIEVDGEAVNQCVRSDCTFGASCRPECNCACQGCDRDQLCDVQHSGDSARSTGQACVPAACYNPEVGEFDCGPVTRSGASFTCLSCDGI